MRPVAWRRQTPTGWIEHARLGKGKGSMAKTTGDMTVREAHDVMDEIETKLLKEFPGMEILIHPDPEGLVNETGSAAVDLLADRDGVASPA